ncbi:competence protein ComGF [Tenuibacillus multivorans]|uniref:Competence protein ComGF n=2 Tax=Tenuibacillus multivorans TaxID=237069 RepID=A0A1G9Z983_9BACI|nr:competence protein ComGF [Tenuibacillus multivorans]
MTLSIFIIISPLLLSFIKLVVPLQPQHGLSDMELRQFHFFVDQALNQSIQVQLEENGIHFIQQDGIKVTYERYNHIIRRRVNDQGHEILLRNVSHYEVIPQTDDIFVIKIIRGDQHAFQRTYFYNDFASNP